MLLFLVCFLSSPTPNHIGQILDPLVKGIADDGTAVKPFPPAIVKINGQDAATLLESMNLKYSSYQDPDSQWNSQLPSYASTVAAPVLAASLGYNGDKVTVTYEDGSEKSQDSFALIRNGANFTGVKTGEDFYQRFCTPNVVLSASDNIEFSIEKTNSSTNSTTPTPPKKPQPKVLPRIEGYPWPAIRDNGGNITAGYFLNGTGYDTVAVLALTAFEPDGIDGLDYLSNYQEVIQKFLDMCKEEGKTKLVIDVTSNGGGYVLAGYELFAQVCLKENPPQRSSSQTSKPSRQTTSDSPTPSSTWLASATRSSTDPT